MLKSIVATFECDECEREFFVPMDPKEKVFPGWTLAEEADSACAIGDSSVQARFHLCPACTEAADKEVA